MTKTILNGNYTSTVDVGNGQYGASITVNGNIRVGFYGADGVFASGSVYDASVFNDGSIVAGPNGNSGNAGTGIYLGGYGNVENFGSISGGNAGPSHGAQGFEGGTGVYLYAGGTFSNGSGTIKGGQGGQGGGYGGAGVILKGLGSIVKAANSADIIGGAAGVGGHAVGGTGVALSGQGSYFYNEVVGTISGGGVSSASKLGYGDNAGGIGLFALSSTIQNEGVITGGGGSAVSSGAGGAGGVGVVLGFGASLLNGSQIAGGFGGYAGVQDYTHGTGGAGGIGVQVSGGSTAINLYRITGGEGGYGTGIGGQGGVGVFISGNSVVTNQAHANITGGAGGASVYYGGAGGAGVYLNGGTLINDGTIAGGAGGAAAYPVTGADAVQFGTAASTLIVQNYGVFIGNVEANPDAGDTLVLDDYVTLTGLGVQFQGFDTIDVVSGYSTTLAGTNTTYGFETVQIGARLSVTGTFVDDASTSVATHGTLYASGSGDIQANSLTLDGGALACGAQAIFEVTQGAPPGFAQTGIITIDPQATLSGFGVIAGALVDNGTLLASGGTLAVQGGVSGNGTLSANAGATLDLTVGMALGIINGAGTLQLDGTLPYTVMKGSVLSVGNLTIDPNVTLSGAGKIMSTVSNAGTIVANGGALILYHGVSGNGALIANSGATLDFAGGLPTTGTISGLGTLGIDRSTKLTAGLTLAVANVEETANLTLQYKLNFTNATGHNFTFDPTTGRTITLAGSGDKFSNAGIMTENGAGTADVNIAFVNTATVSATSGTLAFLGSVTNAGTMKAAGGTLDFAKQVAGIGTLGVGQGGTLLLADGTGTGQNVQFQGVTGLLELTTPSAFGGFIDDFGAANQIDLVNTAATGFTFTGGVMSVQDNGATVASLNFVGPYHQSDFVLASDGHGGTMLTFT
jgi:hypothetical protein